MNSIRAIVFDLDQTLFDRQLAFDRWIARLNVSHRDRASLQRLDQNGSGDRTALFAAYESMTGQSTSQPEFARSLVQCIEPYRGLREYLQRLQNRFTLAVLTNGGTDTQTAKLRSLSLEPFFSAGRFFVSEQIGVSKPDRRAFDIVATALDVPAHQCLYIGDRVETDIGAARNAGWRACHVRGPADLATRLRAAMDSHGDSGDRLDDESQTTGLTAWFVTAMRRGVRGC